MRDSWSVEVIHQALVSPRPSAEGITRFTAFDVSTPVGAGVAANGHFVLLIPGAPGGKDLTGRNFQYRHWTTVKLEDGSLLAGVGALEVEFPDPTEFEIDALSTVFTGLIDLARTTKTPSRLSAVVQALAHLFEERMSLQVDPRMVSGLFGELLAIYKSSRPSSLIAAWHVDLDDQYDFSCGNRRLEVKTTIQNVRRHHFSNAQLPGSQYVDVVVVSVMAPIVAQGVGIGDLFDMTVAMIDDDLIRSKLADQCFETLGTDPHLVLEPNFDIEAATASIAIFTPDSVPTPIMPHGVIRCDWTAELRDDDAGTLGCELVDFLIPQRVCGQLD